MALENFGESIVLGLLDLPTVLVSSQVMGFIEHTQVPDRGLLDSFHPATNLQGVDAGDEPVVFGEGV